MTSEEQFEAWFASKFPKINEKASDPTDPVRGQVKEVARYAWKYSRETLRMHISTESLGKEFSQVIDDNFWELVLK